jgi:hypothetical protein
MRTIVASVLVLVACAGAGDELDPNEDEALGVAQAGLCVTPPAADSVEALPPPGGVASIEDSGDSWLDPLVLGVTGTLSHPVRAQATVTVALSQYWCGQADVHLKVYGFQPFAGGTGCWSLRAETIGHGQWVTLFPGSAGFCVARASLAPEDIGTVSTALRIRGQSILVGSFNSPPIEVEAIHED